MMLALAMVIGVVYGCGIKDLLFPTEPFGSSPTVPSTEPSTEPTYPSLGLTPTQPTAPQPVEYSLTGLWFWLDSSYQAGNSGESFANYHSDLINVSVSWEPLPEHCTDGPGYIHSFIQSQQTRWDSTTSGQTDGVAYGICSTNQGRYMALGVYVCNGMVGKIVAEGNNIEPQALIDVVTSGRVVAEQTPGFNPAPDGYQIVEFGGLQLQISESYLITQEADSVSCTYGTTAIMICFDSLSNYVDCTSAAEIASHNAPQYQGVWETVETEDNTIRMYDTDGQARILVYYLQGQTLWEVSASGTFTGESLEEMCQLLRSAQLPA